MAYEKINWKNHIVEFPFRRKIEDNEDGTYNVKPDVGEIMQMGTKQSAENFNHMEDGIADLDNRITTIESGEGNYASKEDVEALKKKVGEVNVTELEEKVTQLQTKVGEVDISELKTKVDTMEQEHQQILETLNTWV